MAVADEAFETWFDDRLDGAFLQVGARLFEDSFWDTIVKEGSSADTGVRAQKRD